MGREGEGQMYMLGTPDRTHAVAYALAPTAIGTLRISHARLTVACI